jgi:hypothetical protein
MKFDLEKFSNDIFRHRNITLKIGRPEAQRQSGMNTGTIKDIEIGNISEPSITTVIRACEWMGVLITDYLIR